MRLKKVFIALLAALTVFPLHGSASCPPNIPGDTIFWVIALCQARAETDDFESPAVQDCITRITTRNKAITTSSPDCKLNADFKKEWCASLVKNGVEPSVVNCVLSSEAVPPVVRKGQVGD